MTFTRTATCAVWMLTCVICQGQTQPNTPAAQKVPESEPVIASLRKSVAFIKLRCNESGVEYDVKGTGFFVAYPDPRLPKDGAFIYLVTNRHVALCQNDLGKPMQVDNISLTMNRKSSDNGYLSQDILLNARGNASWLVPSDASIDLAVIPYAPDQNFYDYDPIPLSMFATGDFLKKWKIMEGDSIFFAGFFYQFPGITRMEPIVRQGTIAMMPRDKFPFTGIAERVYLADVHAFHGNSGSPAFFDLDRHQEGTLRIVNGGYHLLGVVNGLLTEDEKFNLQLASTLTGTAAANSGITTIVPADELRDLLDDPRLQGLRDNDPNINKPTKR